MRSGICFCDQIQIEIWSFAFYVFLLLLLLFFLHFLHVFCFFFFWLFDLFFFCWLLFWFTFFSHFLRKKHIPLFYRIWLEAVNIRLMLLGPNQHPVYIHCSGQAQTMLRTILRAKHLLVFRSAVGLKSRSSSPSQTFWEMPPPSCDRRAELLLFVCHACNACNVCS